MKFRGVDYYDINSLLTNEEKMTRQTVRDFMEAQVKPLVVDAFNAERPLDMKKLAPLMGELGIIGSFIPREYGAAGTNYTTFGLICQEVERVDSALRSFIAVSSGLVMYPCLLYTSPSPRDRTRSRMPSSA